jgi:hypothetical protein
VKGLLMVFFPFKEKSAQLSLEYIILLLAFFSVFALVFPLLQDSYSLAVFGFDSMQASAFSKEFAERVSMLSILADGSYFSIEAWPLSEWIVKADGNVFSVSLNRPGRREPRVFSLGLSQELNFEKRVSKKTSFFLSKQDGFLTVDTDGQPG